MNDSSVSLPRTDGLGAGVYGLSVIIVSMNNKGYLISCLESLYTARVEAVLEVIVVDNGSTDGTQHFVNEKFPEVRVIHNDRNLGLSRATNQGIAASRGRHVLLLNDDTIVNGPSLDAMVRFLDSHPDAAAVGGRLLNPDGSLQAGYSRFPSLGEELLIATRLGSVLWGEYPLLEAKGKPRAVDWLGSACLMLRRESLDKVGVLDEEYFIYGDETDLQYRLHRAGWNVYYLPSSWTIHYGGRSMDRWRRRKMVYRGKMLFYRKNYGCRRSLWLRLMFAGLSAVKTLIWCGAFAIPRLRDRARNELRSNLDVLDLCRKLI